MIFLQMKRGIKFRVVIFSWSTCSWWWGCEWKSLHATIVNLFRLQIKPQREWRVCCRSTWPNRKHHIRLEGKSCRLKMPCWGRNPFGFRQHLQKLLLLPPLLHFLQLSEPLLQQSNGGTNHSRIGALPTHWREEFEGKGFVVFCVFLGVIGSEGKNEVNVFI